MQIKHFVLTTKYSLLCAISICVFLALLPLVTEMFVFGTGQGMYGRRKTGVRVWSGVVESCWRFDESAGSEGREEKDQSKKREEKGNRLGILRRESRSEKKRRKKV